MLLEFLNLTTTTLNNKEIRKRSWHDPLDPSSHKMITVNLFELHLPIPLKINMGSLDYK